MISPSVVRILSTDGFTYVYMLLSDCLMRLGVTFWLICETTWTNMRATVEQLGANMEPSQEAFDVMIWEAFDVMCTHY